MAATKNSQNKPLNNRSTRFIMIALLVILIISIFYSFGNANGPKSHLWQEKQIIEHIKSLVSF